MAGTAYTAHTRRSADPIRSIRPIGDQTVLLLYALTALLSERADTVFLTGLLYTIIYITMDSYLQGRISRRILDILFLAALFFYPQLLCFSPVLLYGLLAYQDRVGLVLLLSICLYQAHLGAVPALLHQIPGYAAAFLLWQRTSALNDLEEQYRQTRDDSRELNLLLKEKNQMLLKDQDNEIYTATLKERNRIAREIHDHVGHMLSCSILMTGAVRTINTDPVVGQSLRQLEDTLHGAMDNIRQSVHDLHDGSVDLKSTLEHLAASYTFCPVSLEYDMGRHVPVRIRYALIAIVKEALHNIASHSNADRAQIVLREHPGLYQLQIRDNGTQQDPPDPQGLGLSNMRDRADLLGGSMQIYTDEGFHIFITIPKDEGRFYEDHDR